MHVIHTRQRAVACDVERLNVPSQQRAAAVVRGSMPLHGVAVDRAVMFHFAVNLK